MHAQHIGYVIECNDLVDLDNALRYWSLQYSDCYIWRPTDFDDTYKFIGFNEFAMFGAWKMFPGMRVIPRCVVVRYIAEKSRENLLSTSSEFVTQPTLVMTGRSGISAFEDAIRQYGLDTIKQNKTPSMTKEQIMAKEPVNNERTQSLTLEELKELSDIACNDWQNIFLAKVKAHPFESRIHFTDEQVALMFVEATRTDQKSFLNSHFENVVVKPKDRNAFKPVNSPGDCNNVCKAFTEFSTKVFKDPSIFIPYTMHAGPQRYNYRGIYILSGYEVSISPAMNGGTRILIFKKEEV